MKITSFNLMSYADIDLSVKDKFRSAWVLLPNSYFDPVKGHALYNRYLDELELADELGFDGVAVNEHHQTAYGLMPAPNLIASALIERTRGTKVRIAVLGRALPIVNNPVTIAEEFAMLDNMSEGRLIAGFVRGIGCEYHSSMVNPILSHERFHEAHDLIVQAWTRDGPFDFVGEHYNLNYVSLWPRPVQLPHPPIWVPSQGSRETIEWVAAPERKYPLLMAFSPVDTVVRFHEAYRKAALDFGYEVSGDQLGWSTPVYVGESDEEAYAEAAPHIEALFNHFFHIPLEYLFPPGYTSINSFQAMMEFRKGLATSKQTLSDLMTRGNCIVGSPKTVAARIRELHERTGFRLMVPMIQFGTLPDDLVRKSTRLFASEVAPALRGL